jgi:hypothetical protein
MHRLRLSTGKAGLEAFASKKSDDPRSILWARVGVFDPSPRKIQPPPEPPDLAETPGEPTVNAFISGKQGALRMRRLFLYSLWVARVQQDAQDGLQEALTRISSGERSWDAAKNARAQYIFIMQVIDSVVSHDKTAARTRREKLSSQEHGDLPDVVDTQEPTPLDVLEAVEDHEAEKQWVAGVRAVSDDEEKKIIDASQREIEDVGGQVADAGLEEKVVLKARKRLRYKLEESLPKGLRERAKAAIERIRGREQRAAKEQKKGDSKDSKKDGTSAASMRLGQDEGDETGGDEGGAS